MPNFSYSNLERAYFASETTFGTAVAASGSNCCRITKMNLENGVDTIVRPDKTGSRTRSVGVGGRRTGKWSVDLSMSPNGAAGTKPDFDPLMVATFGSAGTVVSSTSVTYSLSDAVKSFTAYSYRQPSTIDQRASIGSVVQHATFNLGADGASTCSFDGKSIWVLESNQFSGADVTQKGGLASFAAEPASPVTNGGLVTGFLGVATLNSSVIATFRTATVSIETGNDIVAPFGTYYSTQAEGDFRNVTTTFSLFEDDSASFTGLIAAAESKTPINISYQLGVTAGSILTFNLSNVQLPYPSREEQRRYVANWGASVAHGTGNKDEITAVFT